MSSADVERRDCGGHTGHLGLCWDAEPFTLAWSVRSYKRQTLCNGNDLCVGIGRALKAA